MNKEVKKHRTKDDKLPENCLSSEDDVIDIAEIGITLKQVIR